MTDETRRIARLKGATQTAQINIKVTPEFKARWVKLKTEKKVDMPTESREAMERLVEDLEKAS